MEFYERLLNTRKSKGLTQSAIAKELGISRQAYAHYETGRSSPDVTQLASIAQLLDVSVDYLLGNEEINNDNELNEYLEQLRTRPEMRMIFSLTSSATKEDVEKLVKMAEVMFGKN